MNQQRTFGTKGMEISIEGVIDRLGDVHNILEESGGIVSRTSVEYKCEDFPYQGKFFFYGHLGEEVIGRRFNFKERYHSTKENFPENVPVVQHLRVWNPNGVGCRDYHFVDKKQYHSKKDIDENVVELMKQD